MSKQYVNLEYNDPTLNSNAIICSGIQDFFDKLYEMVEIARLAMRSTVTGYDARLEALLVTDIFNWYMSCDQNWVKVGGTWVEMIRSSVDESYTIPSFSEFDAIWGPSDTEDDDEDEDEDRDDEDEDDGDGDGDGY